MNNLFQGLEPQGVLRNFWALSQVHSRRADHTQGISDYLADFGRRLGLEVYQDETTNVIIYKPASPGFEQAPTVMLAAHMDMICAANPGVDHDFDKEPLHLLLDEDGDTVRADGTTLGADCGLGMAFILAVLEARDIPHPALEAVFTTNEETDMRGALELDYGQLCSKLILSLDATRLSLGGSGELEMEMFMDRNTVPAQPGALQARLSISGLIGGHSGKNAFIERGNAVTLLTRVLSDLQKKIPFRIVSFTGGYETACAFAREAACVISFSADRKQELEAAAAEWQDRYRKELAVPDPNVTLMLEADETLPETCDDATTERLITLLTILPDGLCSLHKYFEHKYETCVNQGVVEMTDSEFRVVACIRSSSASKKYHQLDKIQRVCGLLGVRLHILHDLPQWEYVSDSRLAEVIRDIYSDLEPNIAQGTCEQGIFLDNMPGAEAAGVGPLVNSPHSPNESFSIKAAAEDWKRFLQVLEALKSY